MVTTQSLLETGSTEKIEVQDYLRAILDATPYSVALIDAKGTIVTVNGATVQITGYPEEEIVGRSFEVLRMLPLKTVLDIQSRFKAVMSGLEVPPFQADVCARSGERLSLEIQLSPWTKMGKVVGAVALMKRGSDCAAAEPVPQDAAERFRDLVETTSDTVWEMDGRSAYTYISPQVYETLGYKPEEAMGRTLFDFMTLQEAQRLTRTIKAAIDSQKPFRFIQAALHKNGSTVFLETSGVPFYGRDGRLVGYRGIHRDVSERRAAEGQVHQTIKKLETTIESVIQAISLTIEMRDHYTAGHQQRVNQLACAVAREMHLPFDKIQTIRVAALVHDFGKLFVPTEILIKPGKLNELELSLIRAHPQSGYYVLKNIQFPWPIADIIVQHHERMDGSGYPSHLRAEDISLEARILAVSDVVEAMTFDRAYRPALGLDAALRELNKSKSTLYDPKVAEACLDAFLDRGFKWERT